jgi:hypothetical protein
MSRLPPLPRIFSASPRPRPRAFSTRDTLQVLRTSKNSPRVRRARARAPSAIRRMARLSSSRQLVNKKATSPAILCPFLPSRISKHRHAFRINPQTLAAGDQRGGSPRARAAGRSSTASDVAYHRAPQPRCRAPRRPPAPKSSRPHRGVARHNLPNHGKHGARGHRNSGLSHKMRSRAQQQEAAIRGHPIPPIPRRAQPNVDSHTALEFSAHL